MCIPQAMKSVRAVGMVTMILKIKRSVMIAIKLGGSRKHGQKYVQTVMAMDTLQKSNKNGLNCMKSYFLNNQNGRARILYNCLQRSMLFCL